MPKRRASELTAPKREHEKTADCYYVFRSSPALEGSAIFTNWKDCEAFVVNSTADKRCEFRKFFCINEAISYLKESKAVVKQEEDTDDPPAASKKARVEAVPSTGSRVGASNLVKTETNSKSKTKAKSNSDYQRILDVYTDGACSKNGYKGARAGWGVYYGPNDPRNMSGHVEGAQTNQRAELQGIREALRKERDSGCPLRVNTDSQYAKKAVTEWLPKWKKNGWKNSTGAEVANQDLIRDIDRLIQNRQGPTEFRYVPGHSNVYGNNQADKLARNARLN